MPRTVMGLHLRALGISPGLRIGSSFRWLIRDRPTYRQWLLAVEDAALRQELTPDLPDDFQRIPDGIDLAIGATDQREVIDPLGQGVGNYATAYPIFRIPPSATFLKIAMSHC